MADETITSGEDLLWKELENLLVEQLENFSLLEFERVEIGPQKWATSALKAPEKVISRPILLDGKQVGLIDVEKYRSLSPKKKRERAGVYAHWIKTNTWPGSRRKSMLDLLQEDAQREVQEEEDYRVLKELNIQRICAGLMKKDRLK